MPAARRSFHVLIALAVVAAGCTEPTHTGSDGGDVRDAKVVASPTVTATLPSGAPRDTTLDVQITGSGFDNGSNATFTLSGVVDSLVRVNSTRYVKSTQLIANVTIAPDAVTDLYDVEVVTAAGKKGIGTELFAVTLTPEVLASGTHVFAVNDAGDAVGRAPTLLSCAAPSAPALWHLDGVLVRLPLGAYCGGTAQAINHSGVISGSLSGGASNASGLWIPSGSGYTLQDIAPAPDGYRPITQGGMNDNMELIGWGQQFARLYWWSPTTGWLSIQVPTGATACQVHGAINNYGVIAGNCSIGGAAQNGYVWQDHASIPVQLPQPVGAGDVVVSDMNDAGVIVGYLYGSLTRAVMWVPNGTSYVVSFLPDRGLGSVASAIAADGSIAGTVNGTANSPNPTIWAPGGASYQILGVTKPGTWAEALAIAQTPLGIIAGGTQNNAYALRWRSSP